VHCTLRDLCYRGIDPCEDTERPEDDALSSPYSVVTGASIRVRILKAQRPVDLPLLLMVLQGHRSV